MRSTRPILVLAVTVLAVLQSPDVLALLCHVLEQSNSEENQSLNVSSQNIVICVCMHEMV